jgi:lipoate-protein ligase A
LYLYLKQLSIIQSNSQDAYYNLALEEYLVLHSQEDILLFYINDDAVVIGKHQNPWKEVNLAPLPNSGQHKVIRRLSGGGTVFHDTGNINFSFIRNKDSDFVDFREHIEPISEALAALGIPNLISPRNDIFVNERKVSGNAEHVNSKVKRILHHGTLLYDSNIIKLNGSIRPTKALKIKTHAVDSVRSPVMNMREVNDLGDTRTFLAKLIDTLNQVLDIKEINEITPSDYNEVNELVKTKYTTWSWNFGHTPQFTYTNQLDTEIKIRKGHVTECKDNTLIGKRFDEILNDE